ncbi:hypothetical protein GQ53DRAFT_50145 [Thozetella sp. PMI_491]|nr:hypothetical protein GQ53DRAFT_50145 [Thozetella sp. PMI_491]
MQEVQQILLSNVGRQSVLQLQTLMILVCYRFATDHIKDVWMLLAIAARIAFTRRLNHEQPSLDPTVQESLRRLMWLIFWLDKLFSGGVDDLVVCPTEQMHIRLPSNDYDFECGLSSISPYLTLLDGDNSSRASLLAFNIRLYHIRERILRYTKLVIQSGASPFDSRTDLQTLDAELQRFQASLPENHRLSERRLMMMAHSRESTGYVMLHTRWHLARGDLYRFLVPGIRESVSIEAMEATPVDFADHCQVECLESSLLLCDLWSSVYHLDARRPINDRGLPVSIYQCAKRIDRLCHLLPSEGNHCLESIRGKLTEAVSMTAHLRGIHAWIDGCINDTVKLLPVMGLRGQTTSSRHSPNASETPDHIVLRSKHSLIEANLDQSAITSMTSPLPPAPGDLGPLSVPEDGHSIIPHTAPVVGVAHTADSVQPLQEQIYGVDDMNGASFTFEGQDFGLPWSPFESDPAAGGAEGLSSLYM